MHEAAFQWVHLVTQRVQIPRGAFLEVGGRNINGTIRPLLEPVFATEYTSIDLHPGPGVDHVGNATLFWPAQPVACVVCCEVLEHAPDAEAICTWAHTVLDLGGLFIVTAASPDRPEHSGIDGGPLQPGEFYRGVSEADLFQWLSPFTEITMDRNTRVGDVYAVARK